MGDSPRWCGYCARYGNHHSDRCPRPERASIFVHESGRVPDDFDPGPINVPPNFKLHARRRAENVIADVLATIYSPDLPSKILDALIDDGWGKVASRCHATEGGHLDPCECEPIEGEFDVL